jgi:hypothetical protein
MRKRVCWSSVRKERRDRQERSISEKKKDRRKGEEGK